MPKVILVPVGGTPADAGAFAMALAAGRLFDAHLVALHVRPDVRQDIATLAASDGGMAVGLDTMTEQMETDADQYDAAASAGWRAFCAANDVAVAREPSRAAGEAAGMTAEWIAEIGREADWLAAHGRTADLIVMGRDEAIWGADTALMEAAFMDTGKPVLIAPSGDGIADPRGTVGIAWKDTRESASAVRAALPFLRLARKVIIFTVSDGEIVDDSPNRLARMLRWHVADVSIQPMVEESRPPADVLLEAAVAAGCGLLVMGGYGHSSFRQALFGGFTRAVLDAAPLPVLVAH